ncbi:CAP domain-containing protein [Acaryochloris marina]|uniref:SCP-like Type I secretion target protein n=1 Tax=Acaryochloris marina (strain MBIC 11017) TaxID=329726 RepID=A8ZPZ5_ACAM1|nr:CAP domain-containing protein [Acaryochloris marina]ABW33170.1 SCP-like Type I secretion target protein [Acaryochloris marina MBIC11017]
MTILEQDRFDQQLLDLVNQERESRGLRPLQLSQNLDQAADQHSARMATGDFFAHRDPQTGTSAGDRIEAAGYTGWSTWGENIAAGQATPEAVLNAWMGSSGHRANILNPNFTHMGIGYDLLENDTGNQRYSHYWTQVFGAGGVTGTYVAQTDGNTTAGNPSNPNTPPAPVNPPLTPPVEAPLVGTPGNDQLIGTDSNDNIFGRGGNDILRGQFGNDMLYGEAGQDRLYGDAGADQLYGGLDNDTLWGGAGNDSLIGVDTNSPNSASQVDVLVGGQNADMFVLGDASAVFYNDGIDNTYGTANYAYIYDFQSVQGDQIQLSGSSGDYRLQSYSSGHLLFLNTPGADEVIAFIANTKSLSLTNSVFMFV